MTVWLLTKEGAPPRGDLDDQDTAFWVSQVAPRGLDEPYDPADEEGWVEDLDDEKALWEEWLGYAEERGRPLTSCRDVIEFMVELELLERVEAEDGIWRVVSPLRHVEDVLPLSSERQAIESQIRWREGFREASQTITDWLREKRPPVQAKSEIETSIEAIAKEVGLDPEDARHGLAILLNEDVRCSVDPETARSDELLRLRIDWELFEEWRTVYSIRPEGDEET